MDNRLSSLLSPATPSAAALLLSSLTRLVAGLKRVSFYRHNSCNVTSLTRPARPSTLQSHTAGTPASVRATFKNSTYSAVIGDNLQFESDRPDWLEASLPIPAEFVKGNYGSCAFPCVLPRN